MQLSSLKNLYIQFSLSKNNDLKRKSEILYQVIELYKSKYKNELFEDVGISMAAEELLEKLSSAIYRDSYFDLKVAALKSCIIKYSSFEELTGLTQLLNIDEIKTFRIFYEKLYTNKIFKKGKREDLEKVFSLLEVTNDSVNSNNS